MGERIIFESDNILKIIGDSTNWGCDKSSGQLRYSGFSFEAEQEKQQYMSSLPQVVRKERKSPPKSRLNETFLGQSEFASGDPEHESTRMGPKYPPNVGKEMSDPISHLLEYAPGMVLWKMP